MKVKDRFFKLFMVAFVAFTILSTTKVNAAILSGITGDDIINQAKTYAGWTYNGVGTCIGLVVRTLNDLGTTQFGTMVGSSSRYSVAETIDLAHQLASQGLIKEVHEGPTDELQARLSADPNYVKNGDVILMRGEDRIGSSNPHAAFMYLSEGTIQMWGGVYSGANPDVGPHGDFGSVPAGISLASILNINNYSEFTTPGESGIMPLSGTGGARVAHIFRLVDDEKYVNVRIYKKAGGADYGAVKTNLAGTQFRLTSSKGTFDTNVSGADGVCYVEHIPAGDYTISEIQHPANVMGVADFSASLTEADKTYEYELEDPLKKMRIEINKGLLAETVGRTDAKVSGAMFTIYTDSGCTQALATFGPTDDNGYALSGTMPTGSYWVKETTFPEGIDPKAKIPGEDVTYEDKVYPVSADVNAQGEETVTLKQSVTNKPKMGRVTVKKYNDVNGGTEERPAAGAKLRLTLDSNPSVYYTVTLDQNGEGEFIYQAYKDKYPDEECTIPYGTYTITEEESSDDDILWYIQPKNFKVSEALKTYQWIFDDEGIDMHVHVLKIDEVTKWTIKGKNDKPESRAWFQIYDCQNNKFVTQMIYEEDEELGLHSGDYTDIFKTNEDGEFYTPHELEHGKYILYEIKAPEGYSINPKVAKPENTNDVGDSTKGGLVLVLDKSGAGVGEDESYPEGGIEPGDVVFDQEVDDKPLTARLRVHKMGEQLVGTNMTATDYGETLYSLLYDQRPLEGIKFKITIPETLYSPDGGVWVDKNTFSSTMVTDEDGYALSDELIVGAKGATYHVEEIDTPAEYKPVEFDVFLENTDRTYEAPVITKEVTNERMPFTPSIIKEFEARKYGNKNDTYSAKVVFGLYNKDTIYDSKGKTLVRENSLVGLFESDELTTNGGELTIENTLNLPEGQYYLKEIEVSDPYKPLDDEIPVELKYNRGTEVEKDGKISIKIDCGKVNNEIDNVKIALYKISTSSFDIPTKGGKFDEDKIEAAVEDLLSEVRGKTIEEANEYIKERGIKTLAGAEYGVYYYYEDENNNLPVVNLETGENVRFVTQGEYITEVELDDLPAGTYYLHEEKAPDNKLYKVNEKTIKVDAYNESERVFPTYVFGVDDTVNPEIATKTDIFTGQPVENCEFEIRDKDGNVVHKDTSDAEGVVTVPLDKLEKGETYTFNETNAPDLYKQYGDMYELNTEPHEFVADFDENGNWLAEHIKIENVRPTRKLIVRKTDRETGDPLQGCVFSIIEIDPQTREPKLDKDGNYIYMVKEAVTDENGEFTVEKAPKGSWKFIEVQAPEGYELEEQDLEGYEFDITDDSPETIILEVTNTGDIAVIAIACVAVVCVLGIVYVIIKNKKQKSTK